LLPISPFESFPLMKAPRRVLCLAVVGCGVACGPEPGARQYEPATPAAIYVTRYAHATVPIYADTSSVTAARTLNPGDSVRIEADGGRRRRIAGGGYVLWALLRDTPAATPHIQEQARLDSIATAAAAAERARRGAQAREALSAMRTSTDEFDGTTWYKDPTHPQYADNNALRAYIGSSPAGGPPWLRLLVRYSGERWLFVERIRVLVDGREFELEPGYGGMKRDAGGGDVWEWYDTSVGRNERELINAVADADRVKVRFVGDQYHRDWEVPTSQVAAMRRVLLAYEELSRR
jgi:hypothetical protein